MTDLDARYGTRNGFRRGVLLAVVGVLVLAGLGVVGWAVVVQSRPKVQSELVSYDVLDDHLVEGRFRVVRREKGERATCLVRAIAQDHSIVGESQVTVGSGGREQIVTAPVRTERRATSFELLGCTAPGQPDRR